MQLFFLIEGPVGWRQERGVAQSASDRRCRSLLQTYDPPCGQLFETDRKKTRPGHYPERLQGDPALLTALYLKTTTVRRALSERLKVAVSTSTPGQAEKWQAIAREFSEAVFEVTTR